MIVLNIPLACQDWHWVRRAVRKSGWKGEHGQCLITYHWVEGRIHHILIDIFDNDFFASGGICDLLLVRGRPQLLLMWLHITAFLTRSSSGLRVFIDLFITICLVFIELLNELGHCGNPVVSGIVATGGVLLQRRIVVRHVFNKMKETQGADKGNGKRAVRRRLLTPGHHIGVANLARNGTHHVPTIPTLALG